MTSPHGQYVHAVVGVSEVSFRPNQCLEGALAMVTLSFFPMGKVEPCKKPVCTAP